MAIEEELEFPGPAAIRDQWGLAVAALAMVSIQEKHGVKLGGRSENVKTLSVSSMAASGFGWDIPTIQ